MKEQTSAPAQVSFNEAFRVWTKIGFLSFGGPAGQIGLMLLPLTLNGFALSDYLDSVF